MIESPPEPAPPMPSTTLSHTACPDTHAHADAPRDGYQHHRRTSLPDTQQSHAAPAHTPAAYAEMSRAHSQVLTDTRLRALSSPFFVPIPSSLQKHPGVSHPERMWACTHSEHHHLSTFRARG